MNAMEEYEIYKPSKLQADQLLNDKIAFKSNILYNTAICIDVPLGDINGYTRLPTLVSPL